MGQKKMMWLILKWRWQGGGERLLICPISSPSPTSEYLVVTCGTPGILSNQNDDDDVDDVDDVDGDDEFYDYDDYDIGNDVDHIFLLLSTLILDLLIHITQVIML